MTSYELKSCKYKKNMKLLIIRGFGISLNLREFQRISDMRNSITKKLRLTFHPKRI